jgi:hypothetical protein
MAISNLLFGALILLGVVPWLPRKWSWKTLRTSIAFRKWAKGKSSELELAQSDRNLVRVPIAGHCPYRSSQVAV